MLHVSCNFDADLCKNQAAYGDIILASKKINDRKDTGGGPMKKFFEKIRHIAMVIADDISIIASMSFRKGNELEAAGLE